LEFFQNPEIFSIGRFSLTWYALILVVGLLLAVAFCLRQTKHFGIKQDEVYDMLFCAVPAAVVGARLYYVAFEWEHIISSGWREIYRTWNGGMAIYGCIIGAAVAAAIFCRVRRISAGAMLDLGAMGLLIGQSVGRWGNFVNGEIYGTETALPWRMLVHGREVHPLFLYESLWNILGFGLLWLFMKKRKFNGQMFMLYVAWYGLGRALMEGMRNDRFNLMLGGAMISQLIAIISCVAAIALLFYMTLFRKHPPLLEWTAERDKCEAARKARKPEIKEKPSAAETVEVPEEVEETSREEAANDGGTDGREEPCEDNQE
jgi:phosphatidylglycerol:prolipoprotein diacylglycerol transferase